MIVLQNASGKKGCRPPTAALYRKKDQGTQKPLTGADVGCRRIEHILLIHFDFIRRETEVVSNFLYHHAVDDMRDVFAGFDPDVEDRAAVQVKRVLPFCIGGKVADSGRAGALIAAQQVERRFQLHFLLDKGVGKVFNDYFQLADVLLQPVWQVVKDRVRHGFHIFK